jgi:hypothetical protein
VLVTSGLSTLVYAITKADDYGWGSTETIGLFVVSTALLVGFLAWETRVQEPLVRLGIFRLQTVTGANVAGFILGSALFAMFLMLTLYMQQVLGYSAMKTGVAYLAVAGTSIFWAGLASQLVTKIGVKPVLVTGMTFLTIGLLYFTQVSVGGSYVGDLLPGFLLVAIGMAFSFVPISIAALAGVRNEEQGLASGLINTSQQIGGALGIAVLSTLATTQANDAIAGGTPAPEAFVDGFRVAFIAAAAIAAVGIAATIALVRGRDLEQAPDALPVPAGI